MLCTYFVLALMNNPGFRAVFMLLGDWALALVRLRYFFNSYSPGALMKRGMQGKPAARKGSMPSQSILAFMAILAIPNPS
jgi:hypothetical protein